jgi:hypothetical protein
MYVGVVLFYLRSRLNPINLWMRRVQTIFKIRKGLHELSCALTRGGSVFVPNAQMPYETSEKAFYETYCVEREARDSMPSSIRRITNLFFYKRAHVNVLYDEFDTLDVCIKSTAHLSKEAHLVPFLILREQEEPRKKRDHTEYHDKVRHGS